MQFNFAVLSNCGGNCGTMTYEPGAVFFYCIVSVCPSTVSKNCVYHNRASQRIHLDTLVVLPLSAYFDLRALPSRLATVCDRCESIRHLPKERAPSGGNYGGVEGTAALLGSLPSPLTSYRALSLRSEVPTHRGLPLPGRDERRGIPKRPVRNKGREREGGQGETVC